MMDIYMTEQHVSYRLDFGYTGRYTEFHKLLIVQDVDFPLNDLYEVIIGAPDERLIVLKADKTCVYGSMSLQRYLAHNSYVTFHCVFVDYFDADQLRHFFQQLQHRRILYNRSFMYSLAGMYVYTFLLTPESFMNRSRTSFRPVRILLDTSSQRFSRYFCSHNCSSSIALIN